MNKKGFTLVELVASIALLIIFTTSTIIGFEAMEKSNKERNYQILVNEFETAAKIYIESVPYYRDVLYGGYLNSTNITLETLINYNYLENNIKNPKTGELFNTNDYVTVNLNSEILTYKFHVQET